MTPDVPPPPNESTDDAEDLGQPLVELQDLPVEVDDRFVRQVRGRIERRVMTAELLGLAWTAPVTMLLEFIRIPFEALGRNRRS
jgi:hypothetical protein